MSIGQVEHAFVRYVSLIVSMIILCLVCLAGGAVTFLYISFSEKVEETPAEIFIAKGGQRNESDIWSAPDSTLIPETPEGDMIRYGKELISHTAKYLGPRGKVAKISNGMNCQNCHLKSGTVPFGNNYAAVVSTYPKFRSRSGTIETIEKRINDCIERSLNGQKLAENSVEMRAIMAWFNWVGKDVKAGTIPKGTGITSLPFLTRPADPVRGKMVYAKHCQLCHGVEGQGLEDPETREWKYPPLAGPGSYNTGAGLFRLSRFAGYVKSNMPYGTTWMNPVLSDEDAWDVAAYVNSLQRPEKHFSGDWPDVASKPFDHPFGPYADTFSQIQHKYGPFQAIQKTRVKQQAVK